jgi:hypothetical protein
MTRPGFEPEPPLWEKPATNPLSYGAAIDSIILVAIAALM